MSHDSILLVEPPEHDRTIYATFLREHGFNVTEVDSTDAGLSAARTADLVITAIRMDGSFDGVELVRRLRHDEHTKATPLIVLTQCAFEPDQSRAFAAGCDVFLPKPCLPDLLLTEARRLIDEARRLQTHSAELQTQHAETHRPSRELLDKSNALLRRRRKLPKPQHR